MSKLTVTTSTRTALNRAQRITEIKAHLAGIVALDHDMGMSLVEEIAGWISNRNDHSLEMRARAIVVLCDLLTYRQLGVVLRSARFYNTASNALHWNTRAADVAVCS